jgi:glycosyltransferase involved in cell wall biosynthesis
VVVDNNSFDETQEMLARIAPMFRGCLHCLREVRQGSSFARNAGVAAAAGDIVAFLDDDEEITSTWYRALYDGFQDPGISYIGGPMLPNWEAQPPDWLPVWEYNGVLSIGDASPLAVDYGPGFPGVLISGNSAFRRRVFDVVGLYREDLGRTTHGLGCCEDHDLYLRLLKSGLRGRYVPEFSIYHAIPAERLRASYYRRWVTGQSISQARMSYREDVAYLFGIPRYLFGNVARRTLRVLRDTLAGRVTRKQLFLCELQWRQLGGFLFGTHFPARRKQPAK